METPDPNTTNDAGSNPIYEWKSKPTPPRIFTTACLDLYYHAKEGGWFKLLFTSNADYLARQVAECPPDTKLHYGLNLKLVEACRGLDRLPKEEEEEG